MPVTCPNPLRPVATHVREVLGPDAACPCSVSPAVSRDLEVPAHINCKAVCEIHQCEVMGYLLPSRQGVSSGSFHVAEQTALVVQLAAKRDDLKFVLGHLLNILDGDSSPLVGVGEGLRVAGHGFDQSPGIRVC